MLKSNHLSLDFFDIGKDVTGAFGKDVTSSMELGGTGTELGTWDREGTWNWD